MYEKFVRVTDLTDYLFCPRKVYLKRVLGYKEETNYQMLFGRILHEFFDIFNEEEKEIIFEIKENLGFNYILNLYKDYARNLIEYLLEKYLDEINNLKIPIDNLKIDLLSSIEDDIEERARNVYFFIEKNDVYGIELWEYLEPKIRTELEVFSKKYELVGRIDRLEVYKTIVIPYEIKTGKEFKDHIIQLHGYYFLLRDEFPRAKIPYGVLLYMKKKKKKEVKFSKKLLYKILNIRDKIFDILDGKEPERLYSEKCKKCAFYNICYGNRNRH